jgi:hypothetical protein
MGQKQRNATCQTPVKTPNMCFQPLIETSDTFQKKPFSATQTCSNSKMFVGCKFRINLTNKCKRVHARCIENDARAQFPYTCRCFNTLLPSVTVRLCSMSLYDYIGTILLAFVNCSMVIEGFKSENGLLKALA